MTFDGHRFSFSFSFYSSCLFRAFSKKIFFGEFALSLSWFWFHKIYDEHFCPSQKTFHFSLLPHLFRWTRLLLKQLHPLFKWFWPFSMSETSNSIKIPPPFPTPLPLAPWQTPQTFPSCLYLDYGEQAYHTQISRLTPQFMLLYECMLIKCFKYRFWPLKITVKKLN